MMDTSNLDLIAAAQLRHAANSIPRHFEVAGFQPFFLFSSSPRTYQTEEPKHLKRVRFNESNNREFTTNAEATRSWISEDSLRRMHQRNKHLASLYRQTSAEYSESINYLMQSHKHNGDDKSYRPEDLSQHITRIIKRDCRGLERLIVPDVSNSRRRAQRAVLGLQRKLKRDGVYGTSLGADLLCQQSLSASQPLRQLAFRLAQADELEARLVQNTI
jgi:hypothetical protein